MQTPDEQALIGRRFGEFTVRELLSAGGFGMVFRAEQPALSREAVIKVLQTRHRASETIVQRFLREAQLASKLDHPYAAHTYAFGAEPDGVLWIAMELVRGTPLDKLLEAQGPIAIERFVPLLEAVCEVIHTAHEQGIVHRDLKPANVMVLARAGRLLPKLLDFGIAKATGVAPEATAAPDPSLADTMENAEPRLTQGGATMGSPHYMAPEQWVDAGLADARTDQYALGVLCFEALTGKPPFTGAAVMQLAMAHARKPPPPLGNGLPPALDAVIARAMAKRPDERYPSVLELAIAFRAASGVATEVVALPRLPDALRTRLLAAAPQPLAHAVAALDAARNAHQARDALWQVVRVAVRLLAVAALASRSHVGVGVSSSMSDTGQALRQLRRRGIRDDEWLELARELCRPFATLRDAHPLPELVDFLVADQPALAALLDMRTTLEGSSDEKVRERLERAVPRLAEVLEAIGFLSDYPLVVPGDEGASIWMGVRRAEQPRLRLYGRAVPRGQPLLVDSTGVPVVSLWPYVQLVAPSPGAPDALFFFEGKGRRGARLIALPDSFEHEDESLWDSFGGVVDDAPDAPHAVSIEERSPFPGLAAFTRDDAATFLGRERETEAFVNRLRVQPLLVVVGPSGAGKSSFVQAGVLPALPEEWDVITVRPGPSPLVTLGARLGAGDLRTELADHPGALGSILRARRRTTVLVIDQLEELFTLCEDGAERQLYADALVRAARSAEDPVRIVLTLRDDFLLRAEALPAFRSRLGQGLQLLTTPAEADLRRILTDSVTRAGYEFDDPELPGEMVATLAGTPGALALMSFTASKLWELRDRRFRQLGRKAYASLGGVGGALAHHAEATLEAMPHEEQRLVREVFRHAVTAEGTRAVLSHAELDQVLGGGPHATAVVEKLVAARLLVVSEVEGGSERVEITHEALLDAWPRLVGWRREDAEGARLRDQLRAAARQWDERGRPSGLLWRGDALAEYRLWRSRYAGALTSTEEAFAAASQGDAARARRWRTGLLATAFVVLGAGLVALLLLASRAETERVEAVRSSRLAEQANHDLEQNLQRQYETQGRRLLLDGDPLQALAYLDHARSLGAHGPAHDFLVASAVRASEGEVLEVRGGPVNGVAFSHGGAWFATAGLDHVARVWDAGTGAVLHELAHRNAVISVEFAPDDTSLLTASRDGTAGLWDPRTGAAIHTLALGSPAVCALFAPDGSWILTAGQDGRLRIWDAATGAERRAIDAGAPPRACAIAPDGRRFATGDSAGLVQVWDLDGRVVARLTGHRAGVASLEFARDSAALASASDDATAIIWDIATGGARATLAHRAGVKSVHFSRDGRRAATASSDHTAAVWDANTGQKIVDLQGHTAVVNGAVFTEDAARLVTISDDSTVRLWDLASGLTMVRWRRHDDAVRSVALDESSGRLISGGMDGRAIMWDLEPQGWPLVLRGHVGVIEDASFSPDGTRVATAGWDGTVRLWDASTGAPLLVVVAGKERQRRARFSPDGERLATSGGDGSVVIWDARSGKQLLAIPHPASVGDLTWAPDGRRLATACLDGTLRVVSTDTGRELVAVVAHGGQRLYSATFAPSGVTVATSGEDGVIRIWDAATGMPVAQRSVGDIEIGVRFDRTGSRAVSWAGQAFRLWSVADRTTQSELVGHTGTLSSASWSRDGSLIATGALDGTVRLWETERGDLLDTFTQAMGIVSVQLSPDGRRIVSAGTDGSLAIRDLPIYRGTIEELAKLLQCRVPYVIDADHLVRRARRCAEGPDRAKKLHDLSP